MALAGREVNPIEANPPFVIQWICGVQERDGEDDKDGSSAGQKGGIQSVGFDGFSGMDG